MLKQLNLTWTDTGKNLIFTELADGQIFCWYCLSWQRTHYVVNIMIFGRTVITAHNFKTEEACKQFVNDKLIQIYSAIKKRHEINN